jgi:hypothetical protein
MSNSPNIHREYLSEGALYNPPSPSRQREDEDDHKIIRLIDDIRYWMWLYKYNGRNQGVGPKAHVDYFTKTLEIILRRTQKESKYGDQLEEIKKMQNPEPEPSMQRKPNIMRRH